MLNCPLLPEQPLTSAKPTKHLSETSAGGGTLALCCRRICSALCCQEDACTICPAACATCPLRGAIGCHGRSVLSTQHVCAAAGRLRGRNLSWTVLLLHLRSWTCRALPCAAQPRLPCPAPACEPSADCAGSCPCSCSCSCSWSCLRLCLCGSADLLVCDAQACSALQTKNGHLRSLQPEMWVQNGNRSPYQAVVIKAHHQDYTCDPQYCQLTHPAPNGPHHAMHSASAQ